MEVRIVDKRARLRYEAWAGEKLAGVLRYRPRPDRLTLVHTEVCAEFEGHGLASTLVAGVLDDIRERGLRIVPVCPFVRSYLERHPEHADLIAPSEASSA